MCVVITRAWRVSRERLTFRATTPSHHPTGSSCTRPFQKTGIILPRVRTGSVAKVVLRADVAAKQHLAEPDFALTSCAVSALLCGPSPLIEPSGLSMQVL